MSTDPKPRATKTGKPSKAKPQPSSATDSTTSTPESQEEPTIDSLIAVQVGGVQRQAQFRIQEVILAKHDISSIATMGQIFAQAAEKLFLAVMTELLFLDPDRAMSEANPVSESEEVPPRRLN